MNEVFIKNTPDTYAAKTTGQINGMVPESI
jgi:hypothetical protein